jgi:2-C-methyl-D-erythritol 4-phosphate cytidylyltransferase/2-C-methyl-D-erythritol 2,4-cyclodiphosphate synthase
MAIAVDSLPSEALDQTALILLAAGKSQRMGQDIPDKCRFLIGRKTVLGYAYEAFQSVGDWGQILIVYRDEAQRDSLQKIFPASAIAWILGGATRVLSVYHALEVLHRQATAPQWVLVHDGARPYTSKNLIAMIFSEMLVHGNAIPVKEVTDTLICVDSPSKHYYYPDRRNYYRAETPQGFTFSTLYEAYQSQRSNLASFTDDSAIYQTQSPLHLVIHRMRNDKLTFAEELQYCQL